MTWLDPMNWTATIPLFAVFLAWLELRVWDQHRRIERLESEVDELLHPKDR